MRGLALALLVVLPQGAAAAVDVRVETDGRVSLRADAPASEILDRMAAQTGMKVVYEGGVPRSRVQVAFERRSPAEAVLMVLEGLGLDHVMRLDPTGTRPEMLLLSASTPSTRPLPAPPTHAAPPPRPLPEEIEEEDEEVTEPDDEQEAVEEVEPGPRRPRGTQPNRPAGQQAAPQAPVNRPVFVPPTYPTSPFAPPPPAPPTVVATPIPSPAPEVQGEPDQ